MKSFLLGLGICIYCLGINAQSIQHDIRFSFTAVRDNKFITVNATLHNPGSDTVYLLSTSCDGLPYLLNADSAKFTVSPRLLCNASWPVIMKIPPRDRLDFIAYLTCRTVEKEIKLGFDLYEVDQAFDLRETPLNFRPEKTAIRRILWADVHRFD